MTREAGARGARILTGRCWEAGGAPAYWPWVQSLRAYVRESAPELLRAQLGTGAVELAQILPELRELLPGLPEPAALDSDGARFRLLYATAEFLRNACAARPTVLVLDDLHAADPPSLVLLRFLARELGSIRAARARCVPRRRSCPRATAERDAGRGRPRAGHASPLARRPERSAR